MEHISFEGWLLIGLAVAFIIGGIMNAAYVIYKHAPEFFQPTEWKTDAMAAVLPFDDDIDEDATNVD